MKKPLILTTIGAGILILGVDASITPTPTAIAETKILDHPIDYPRLSKMAEYLKTVTPNAHKEYKKLCQEATTQPKIGMTIDQSRNTTWCFPYSRHTTTTAHGERVQELYLKPDYNGDQDARYSPRQYLYFNNGILVGIQQ